MAAIEAAAIRFQVAINAKTRYKPATTRSLFLEKRKEKQGKNFSLSITMIRFGRRYSNAISKLKHNFARSRSLTNLNGRRHCARTLATTSQGIQLKEEKKKNKQLRQ